MPSINIASANYDTLAKEAARHVFMSMIDEAVTFSEAALIVGDGEKGADLLSRIPGISKGFFTIRVGYVGDTKGEVHISLPRLAARAFVLKLLDAPSFDWLEEDESETIADSLGELGNMMAGLIKGGLTKWYPELMLTTPKVISDRRFKADDSKMSFRKQYVFALFDSHALVEWRCMKDEG